jgi:hypothetical protein
MINNDRIDITTLIIHPLTAVFILTFRLLTYIGIPWVSSYLASKYIPTKKIAVPKNIGRIKARSEGQLYPAAADIKMPSEHRRGTEERIRMPLIRRCGFFFINLIFIVIE